MTEPVMYICRWCGKETKVVVRSESDEMICPACALEAA